MKSAEELIPSLTKKVSPTFELEQQWPEEMDLGVGGRPAITGDRVTPHPPSPTSASAEIPPVATSVRPTDSFAIKAGDDLSATAHVLPTDSLGREIRPVVMFNGTKLREDAEGNFFDGMGRKVGREIDL